jgi:hypothetical protein
MDPILLRGWGLHEIQANVDSGTAGTAKLQQERCERSNLSDRQLRTCRP